MEIIGLGSVKREEQIYVQETQHVRMVKINLPNIVIKQIILKDVQIMDQMVQNLLRKDGIKIHNVALKT